jgi:2,3,4,5-tetrahydropyridine-2-carboxylate N-succinyltransferase
MDLDKLKAGIAAKDPQSIEAVVALLDKGMVRVAEKQGEEWLTHAWIKEAVLGFFRIRAMEETEAGPLHFHDKVPVKKNLAQAGVRVVPPGTIRYGAFVERGAIVMPAYVNIGAYVGSGTMVDTWATVGSCAQIGRDVHLSGGVGIGGVLEPPSARPVIVEDGAFIGSRCIVVEGVVVGTQAVLGAGVVLTASTQIIDVTGPEERIYKKMVPPRSVVIPGFRTRRFASGEYGVGCALIIGQRSASTDLKTSLNSALRDYDVSV